MGDIEHWTIWLMPDSEWPFCVERGISERQIAGVERVEVVRADLYRGAVADERERIINRIRHMACVTLPDDVSRTALTIEKVAAVIAREGGQS